MPTIHRRSADHISVEEAKRLISRAFTPEPVVDLYVEVDPKGNAIPGGQVKAVLSEAAYPRGAFLDLDFGALCQQLNIVPRMIWRPIVREYAGKAHDAMYSLTHDEFVRLASEYGVQVVLAATDPESLGGEGAEDGPPAAGTCGNAAPAATWIPSGEIAAAFAGLHFEIDKWSKYLREPPKWFGRAKKADGKRGGKAPQQSRWDPVALAECLLHHPGWDAPMLRKLEQLDIRFQERSELSASRNAWNDVRDRIRELLT
jgi:hypothetical protein